MNIENETKIKCEVFHSSEEFFWKAIRYYMNMTVSDLARAFRRGKYNLTGFVEVPICDTGNEWYALEYAFEKTQTKSKEWSCKKPGRSTSVGDILKIGDNYYVVAPVEFAPIPELAVSVSGK